MIFILEDIRIIKKMKSDNLKIEFRGKEMSILEAKTYIKDLKSGKIEAELSDEEREHYLRCKKDIDKYKNCSSETIDLHALAIFLSGRTEKEYLINQIKNKINFRLAEEKNKHTEEYIKSMSIITQKQLHTPYGLLGFCHHNL
jgi:hypothetical protein